MGSGNWNKPGERDILKEVLQCLSFNTLLYFHTLLKGKYYCEQDLKENDFPYFAVYFYLLNGVNFIIDPQQTELGSVQLCLYLDLPAAAFFLCI